MPGPVSESYRGPMDRPPAGNVLTCAYCGHEYPPGTPASQHELLSKHIAGCEKHPMRTVILERDELLAQVKSACDRLGSPFDLRDLSPAAIIGQLVDEIQRVRMRLRDAFADQEGE
ncbi:MAG: hypothetical protein PHU85_00090 [Phycisphaerae bacterium]|nr:hypothetical protein [Phycisphaerae bacterium]